MLSAPFLASLQSLPVRHRRTLRPDLRRVTPDLLPLLQRILNRARNLDPYARSASYYAMTGRKGLWLYGTDATGLLIVRHPNLDSTMLAFPPFGPDAIPLLAALNVDDRFADHTLLLGRVTDRHLAHWRAASLALEDRVIEETILDWRYPCHSLDTRLVSDHQGHAFKDFRKNVSRARRAGVTTRGVNPLMDGHTLRALLSSWADSHGPIQSHAENDNHSLTSAALKVIGMAERGETRLAGVIAFQKQNPVGFMLWEETDPARGIANGLANVALPGIKGATETTYLAMCETLLRKGFNEVCIGGSETASLDAFKRKLCPTNSIPLRTIKLRNRARPELPLARAS